MGEAASAYFCATHIFYVGNCVNCRKRAGVDDLPMPNRRDTAAVLCPRNTHRIKIYQITTHVPGSSPVTWRERCPCE